MVDRRIDEINKLLQKQIVQRFGVLAMALLIVGSVAFFGVRQNQSSHAASLGLLSMTLGATGGTGGSAVQGSNITVALREDSGTDVVNAVQASVTYNSTQLQFVSITEGTAFPTIAATSTSTPGVIRVGRSTPAGTAGATGANTIVTLTFKVLGGTGTTPLAYDPAFSFIVRAADNVNTLTSATGVTVGMSLPAPLITSISPASGPTAGGNRVTVTGSNIVSGSTVAFGGVAGTSPVYTLTTPISVTVTVPAHVFGVVNVTLTNPDGQAVSQTGGYTYVAPTPTITSVAPNSGTTAGGTTVTITGTNFANGATVNFSGSAATGVVFTSATSITAVAPARAAGPANVTVINPDKQVASLTSGYTYLAPTPTVTTVSPVSGPTAGGTSVVLTGTNLGTVTSVQVGGLGANFTLGTTATSLTIVTPAHAAGLVDIVVTNPGGTFTKQGAYTYVAPTPIATAISPTSGSIAGGNTLTITGANFISGAKVLMGNGTLAATSVTFVNATTLTAVVPAATTSGPVSVSVINPDGQKTAAVLTYTYLALGDANGDGRVNAIDLSILISHDAQNYPPADFNGDLTVGAADMAILLSKWTW